MAGAGIRPQLADRLERFPVLRGNLEEDHHGTLGLGHRDQFRGSGGCVHPVIHVTQAVGQCAPWQQFLVEDQRKRLRHAGKVATEPPFGKAFPAISAPSLAAGERRRAPPRGGWIDRIDP